MAKLKFNMDRLSVAVKMKRQHDGLTLREMEQLTGIPIANISRVERGEHAPTLAHFAKFCDFTEFEPGFFFTRNGD
jgi:transcriptional regulator with XRE-family HTH domain